MTWVRSPWWDGFWILSGLPIGLALVFLPPAVGFLFFTAAVFLETGHAFSPIVLTWSDAGLRRIAMDRWVEFVAFPLSLFVGVFFVPTEVVFGIYYAWNIYHFGMQNFGVLSLYKRKQAGSPDRRLRDGLLCLVLTVVGMGALPLLSSDQSLGLLFTGVFSFSHWLTDIGLSSRVSRHPWLFITMVLAMGSVGFLWMVPRADHMATRLIPTVLTARWGLGFVHFLYSRWVWKISDPKVRATAGTDIFSADAARCDV
jgi:hypothetical protein